MRPGPCSRSSVPPTVASSTQAIAPSATARSVMPQTRAATSPNPSPTRARAAPSASVAGARGEPGSLGAVISQRWNRLDRVAHDRFALVPVDLEGEQETMREDGGSKRLDVVGQDVVASLERRQ